MLKIGLAMIVLFALGGSAFYALTSQLQTKSPPTQPQTIRPESARPQTTPAQSSGQKYSSHSARTNDLFAPYMAELQQKVKQNWYPPKVNESKRIICAFKLHKDGHVTDARVVPPSEGCENAAANQAALNAINSASPFEPLPQGSPEYAAVQFTFDYNLFRKVPGEKEFRSF